jgi:imidazolonepropionase
VFGGERAGEFEQRLKGATYEEIAKAGGGIVSTVRATRAASEAGVCCVGKAAPGRADGGGADHHRDQVGYGSMLRTSARPCASRVHSVATGGVTVKATCLAAHALPPEFAG